MASRASSDPHRRHSGRLLRRSPHQRSCLKQPSPFRPQAAAAAAACHLPLQQRLLLRQHTLEVQLMQSQPSLAAAEPQAASELCLETSSIRGLVHQLLPHGKLAAAEHDESNSCVHRQQSSGGRHQLRSDMMPRRSSQVSTRHRGTAQQHLQQTVRQAAPVSGEK